MPIGWMTVLKLVPWGDVVRNAPVIVDGAKKLWDKAGRKPVPPAEAGAIVPIAESPADAALLARLTASEAAVAELHEQMQASSALIKALAEQNAELVRRVELNRGRVLWLAALVLLFGSIAALNLVVALSRSAVAAIA